MYTTQHISRVETMVGINCDMVEFHVNQYKQANIINHRCEL